MFIRGFARANQVKVAPQIFRRPVLYMRDRSFFIAKTWSATLSIGTRHSVEKRQAKSFQSESIAQRIALKGVRGNA